MNNQIKNQLITFFSVFFIITLLFYYLMIKDGLQVIYILGIMIGPGISALVTQLIHNKSLKGLGWRFGKTRYHLAAFAIPLFLCLAVYGIVWMVGLGEFSIKGFVLTSHAKRIGLTVPVSLPVAIVVKIFIGGLIGFIGAFGEELGWGGFLTYKLGKSFSFAKTSLIVGLIWGFWHVPGIFMGHSSGKTPLFTIPAFLALSLGFAFVRTWLRFNSGSMWPVVFFHFWHNMIIQSFFDELTINREITQYFTTEHGLGLAIGYMLTAFYLWHKNRNSRPI